jgi:hypothetical protein
MNEQQTINLNFTLTVDAVNVILTALNEAPMPKKFTQPVTEYLVQEANKQVEAAKVEEVTE